MKPTFIQNYDLDNNTTSGTRDPLIIDIIIYYNPYYYKIYCNLKI